MSFGKSKKKEKSKTSTSQVATRGNFDLVTPFGNVTTKDKTITFDPQFTPGQQEGLELGSQKTADLIGGLPGSITAEQAFDNPFFASSRAFLQTPIRRRQEDSARQLQNELSARNQLGSSFEALTKDLQNRQFSEELNSSEALARQMAFNAFQQNIANQVSQLGAVTQSRSQNFKDTVLPLILGLGLPAASQTGTTTTKSSGQSSGSNVGFNAGDILGAIF